MSWKKQFSDIIEIKNSSYNAVKQADESINKVNNCITKLTHKLIEIKTISDCYDRCRVNKDA